jgi:glycerol-3-phosphate dehydrogenase
VNRDIGDAYDLVVVGAGSAGLTAARTAALLGARVLLGRGADLNERVSSSLWLVGGP